MLVPTPYVEVFENMCQQAPKTPWEDVKAIVEQDLGAPIEQLFSKFSETPVASASLAQVHEAYLKSTGEKVAVKV